MRYLTKADLPTIVACATYLHQPVRLAFWLMLEGGFRVGEITHLAWCDLLWESKPRTQIELTAAMTKRRQSRTIPISRTLSIEIADAWHTWAKDRGFGPANYATAKTPTGKALTPRTLQRQFNVLGSKAGGIHLTPHMLRHTFAKRLLAASDLPTVQAALGHRRISTTAIYTQQNTDEIAQAMQRMTPARPTLPVNPPPPPGPDHLPRRGPQASPRPTAQLEGT